MKGEQAVSLCSIQHSDRAVVETFCSHVSVQRQGMIIARTIVQTLHTTSTELHNCRHLLAAPVGIKDDVIVIHKAAQR